MQENASMVEIPTFSGSVKPTGAAYGAYFQREIAGFFSQEFGAYKYSNRFVRACSKAMRKEAPVAAAFIDGIASRSLLSAEEHTLLMLHEEELYHRKLRKKKPHCSAVGVSGEIRKSGGALVGQNWDWNTSYFPWTTVNRFALKGYPRVAALSYPGLPVCAGLNSSGLALMWTGAGYYPPLLPRIGVPTYALVFEILLRNDVPSALDYLKRVPNAGAFIFFLGDQQGKLAIVEATPGKAFIEYSDLGHRANVFESAQGIISSRQKLPSLSNCHSRIRNRVFARTSPGLRRSASVKEVQSILSQPSILIEKSFCHATLMQLVADCRSKKLMFRPWRQKQNSWVEVKV